MDTRTQVRSFIEENFYASGIAAVIDDYVSLLDHGIIDSTGVLELVTFLETQFGLVVNDSEIVPENLDSVERIVRFVERKAGD